MAFNWSLSKYLLALFVRMWMFQKIAFELIFDWLGIELRPEP
jgi:hypothetical protein